MNGFLIVILEVVFEVIEELVGERISRIHLVDDVVYDGQVVVRMNRFTA